MSFRCHGTEMIGHKVYRWHGRGVVGRELWWTTDALVVESRRSLSILLVVGVLLMILALTCLSLDQQRFSVRLLLVHILLALLSLQVVGLRRYRLKLCLTLNLHGCERLSLLSSLLTFCPFPYADGALSLVFGVLFLLLFRFLLRSGRLLG